LREVSKTNPRLYDAITIKLGLGSSYVSQRVKDCLYGKADAKALQRKHHHHDVRGPSVGLWQSLETVGKQVLLRFQLTMTSQLQLILPALSRFEMAIRLGFSRATSGTFVITAGSLRM